MGKLEPRNISEFPKKATKVDTAITIITYQLKKKQRRIDEISRKVEIRESEKIFIGEETELIANVQTLIKYCKNEFNAILGKLPPNASDLENSVLGSIIWQDPIYQEVKRFLKPEHFYNIAHQDIWEAALFVDGPIDVRNVIERLRSTGKLELVGGGHYVMGLTALSSGGNILGHCAVLIEMAIKRELIQMASDLLHNGYDDTTDCFELLEQAEEQFKRIHSWIEFTKTGMDTIMKKRANG